MEDITPEPQLPDGTDLSTRQRVLQSVQLPLVQYLLLYLVVLCVYIPSFWHSYVWDDWTMIANNESLREWKNIPSYFTDPNTFTHDPGDKTLNEWRPLRNIYYLITFKLHALNPAGWHFQHVLLHCLTAALLLALFHRLYRHALAHPPSALLPPAVQAATWFAVLAWAVHPANIEVTAWLKSADDVLACAITLAALLILFPLNQHLTYSRAILGGLVFWIAFLAKISIAPIPLIYVTLWVVLASDRKKAVRHKPMWLGTAMLFAGLAISLLIRKLALGKLEQTDYMAGNLSLMMATMVPAISRYLQLTFWPFWPTVQIADYVGWPLETSWNSPNVIFHLCLLLAAGLIIILISRRNRVFLAAFLFAGLAFAPVSNIIPMMQIMAERFMYFPLMGISLAVSAVWVWWLRNDLLRKIWLPAIVSLALMVSTILRLPMWSDEQTFRQGSVEAAPAGSWRPMFNYALLLRGEGKTTEALRLHLSILEEFPNEDSALIVAMIIAEQGHITSATRYLDKVTSAFPESSRPVAMQADLARFSGETTKALGLYRKALSKDPDNVQLHYFDALINNELGNTTAALNAVDSALSIDATWTSLTELKREIQKQR